MSNKQREALEAALDCIERTGPDSAEAANRQADVIVLLRKALAELKQEPYAWINPDKLAAHGMAYASSFKVAAQQIPLYASPQPREWQELSIDTQISCHNAGASLRRSALENVFAVYKEISAALRAKNGG